MNNQRKQLCLNYLKARKAFREIGDYDEVLHGNDNIVGRIGEAIAHSFLEQKGRNPVVVKNQTNAGYDIICDSGKTQVSVKMITSENTRGSTSKIRGEWQEFIGIELGADLTVKHLAYVDRVNFNKYLSDRKRSYKPVFSRRMFEKGGLFLEAGVSLTKNEINNYKLI